MRDLLLIDILLHAFFSGRLGFLLTANARFFIMLMAPSLGKHSSLLDLAFEAAERTFQGLIFTDFDF
jgi:hypothetical protein